MRLQKWREDEEKTLYDFDDGRGYCPGLESFSGGDRLYARTEYVTGPGKNKTGKVTVKFSSKLNKE